MYVPGWTRSGSNQTMKPTGLGSAWQASPSGAKLAFGQLARSTVSESGICQLPTPFGNPPLNQPAARTRQHVVAPIAPHVIARSNSHCDPTLGSCSAAEGLRKRASVQPVVFDRRVLHSLGVPELILGSSN